MIVAAALTWPDKIGLAVTVISAVGAAVGSCLAAWKSGQVNKGMKPPSNGVNIGSLSENAAVNLSTLVHLVADALDQQVQVPTPRQTHAGDAGATLADPPALPVPNPQPFLTPPGP